MLTNSADTPQTQSNLIEKMKNINKTEEHQIPDLKKYVDNVKLFDDIRTQDVFG